MGLFDFLFPPKKPKARQMTEAEQRELKRVNRPGRYTEPGMQPPPQSAKSVVDDYWSSSNAFPPNTRGVFEGYTFDPPAMSTDAAPSCDPSPSCDSSSSDSCCSSDSSGGGFDSGNGGSDGGCF